MTYKNIYDYFKGDTGLLESFDPESKAQTVEDAALEVYAKLVNHSKERKCEFLRDEIGYIFYSEGLLISFCVKPECRNKENLSYFSNLIKSKLGHHFNCYLYNVNQRGIRFLERMGMKKVNSNNLITLLSI